MASLDPLATVGMGRRVPHLTKTVNQFPNVKRDYVRKISSELHAWDKFGLDSVQERYRKKCSKELGLSAEEVSPFQEVLRGKINFLGMVRGKDNEIYRKYLNWYRRLSNRYNFYLRSLKQQLKLEIKNGEQGTAVGQTTTIVNIDTLNASNAALNLGDTIHGDQIGTQRYPPKP